MDLFVFYGLAALIFVNAAASCIVLLPRIHDSRFLFSAILSLFLSISTFVAFIGTSWSVLSIGFGVYCMGQMFDCLFFSGKSQKNRLFYVGIYAIAALGSLIAFVWGMKILFMCSYIGYWFSSYITHKGYLNSALMSPKEK